MRRLPWQGIQVHTTSRLDKIKQVALILQPFRQLHSHSPVWLLWWSLMLLCGLSMPPRPLTKSITNDTFQIWLPMFLISYFVKEMRLAVRLLLSQWARHMVLFSLSILIYRALCVEVLFLTTYLYCHQTSESFQFPGSKVIDIIFLCQSKMADSYN